MHIIPPPSPFTRSNREQESFEKSCTQPLGLGLVPPPPSPPLQSPSSSQEQVSDFLCTSQPPAATGNSKVLKNQVHNHRGLGWCPSSPIHPFPLQSSSSSQEQVSDFLCTSQPPAATGNSKVLKNQVHNHRGLGWCPNPSHPPPSVPQL